MRILVCGSRGWRNKELIRSSLVEYSADCVIEGGARGADSLAREVARDLGISCIEYRANWAKYGPGAGYIRNREQYDSGHPDLVLAFCCDLSTSKGTKHMISYAQAKGCLVLVIEESTCTCGCVE